MLVIVPRDDAAPAARPHAGLTRTRHGPRAQAGPGGRARPRALDLASRSGHKRPTDSEVRPWQPTGPRRTKDLLSARDATSFELFYLATSTRSLGFFARRTGDAELAADLASETFAPARRTGAASSPSAGAASACCSASPPTSSTDAPSARATRSGGCAGASAWSGSSSATTTSPASRCSARAPPGRCSKDSPSRSARRSARTSSTSAGYRDDGRGVGYVQGGRRAERVSRGLASVRRRMGRAGSSHDFVDRAAAATAEAAEREEHRGRCGARWRRGRCSPAPSPSCSCSRSSPSSAGSVAAARAPAAPRVVTNLPLSNGLGPVDGGFGAVSVADTGRGRAAARRPALAARAARRPHRRPVPASPRAPDGVGARREAARSPRRSRPRPVTGRLNVIDSSRPRGSRPRSRSGSRSRTACRGW